MKKLLLLSVLIASTAHAKPTPTLLEWCTFNANIVTMMAAHRDEGGTLPDEYVRINNVFTLPKLRNTMYRVANMIWHKPYISGTDASNSMFVGCMGTGQED
jgi:hypothetical protein